MLYDLSLRKGTKYNVVDAALSHYIKELNLTKSKYVLYIGFESNLQKEQGYSGAMSCMLPGVCVMTIDKSMSLDQTLVTLAHEMVHVKQHACGKLRYEKYRGKSVAVWNGKRQTKIDYYTSPWELQAFREERVLANSFIHRAVAQYNLGI